MRSALLGIAVSLLGAGALAGDADARANAETILAALDGDPKAKQLVSEPAGRARDALKRARSARDAGDHATGSALEQMAGEWAATARDLKKAADLEKQAAATETEAADAETKALRARTLLEETIARRGRAQRKLDELDAPAGGGEPAEQAPASEQPAKEGG